MPDPVTGLVVGGSLAGGAMSANSQKKAAQSAASAEERAALAQIDASNERFAEIQKLLSPFVQAGAGALGQQQALIGLSGADAQRSAIAGLEGSPQMQALIQQGENAILQNASATGGLRGGNIQAALAQFRPQILSSMIENQYSKLGGLTSIGQNAAAGVGNAGMTTTGMTNQALGNIGSAQAGAALARGQANSQMFGSLGNAAGFLGGSGIFGGSTPAPNAASINAFNSLGNITF